MVFIARELIVNKEKIGTVDKLKIFFPRDICRSIECRVYISLFAFKEKLLKHTSLKHRLTARAGYSAHVFIEGAVSLGNLYHLVHGVLFRTHNTCSAKADIRAFSARYAFIAITHIFTDRQTLFTSDALIGIYHYPRLLRYGLGIMTPFAGEIAPLKKEGCSDTRPIVKTASLYICK